MKQRYCIDTSLFINGWRKHYQPDVFPAFWEALNGLMQDGVLFSCEAVYDEIQAQADELAAWVKQRKKYFEKPTEDILLGMRELLEYFPNLAAESGRTNAADPWVIVHARDEEGAIVVTDEIRQERVSPTKPPKIPNVCDDMGVKWMPPVEFLRTHGVKFN